MRGARRRRVPFRWPRHRSRALSLVQGAGGRGSTSRAGGRWGPGSGSRADPMIREAASPPRSPKTPGVPGGIWLMRSAAWVQCLAAAAANTGSAAARRACRSAVPARPWARDAKRVRIGGSNRIGTHRQGLLPRQSYGGRRVRGKVKMRGQTTRIRWDDDRHGTAKPGATMSVRVLPEAGRGTRNWQRVAGSAQQNLERFLHASRLGLGFVMQID